MYPYGVRVELIELCNDEKDMPIGLRGTVVGVDDQPALLMHWDNGKSLSLLVDKDNFRKLTEQEVLTEFNNSNEEDDQCQTM
ncbi:MAG: hypothetical protein A2Y17_10510 [Clostridiales bacterium GWF2_38_85]|nr:MAG: hypothetical protein A2Y17_10510 [Clostridiales bacterium GWF2_38_85]